MKAVKTLRVISYSRPGLRGLSLPRISARPANINSYNYLIILFITLEGRVEGL
jgi:hypothetical protein